MLRPLILLDVDGVIADFCTSALKVIANLGHGEFLTDDVVHYTMEHLIPEHAREEFLAELRRDGFCHALAPYDGAGDFVRDLWRYGDIVVVTAPMPGASSWMRERQAWLQRHFGLTYVLHTHDKHLVHGDVLIEDRFDTAARWAEAHPYGTALLIDRPYNRAAQPCANLLRVRDYGEMLQFFCT